MAILWQASWSLAMYVCSPSLANDLYEAYTDLFHWLAIIRIWSFSIFWYCIFYYPPTIPKSHKVVIFRAQKVRLCWWFFISSSLFPKYSSFPHCVLSHSTSELSTYLPSQLVCELVKSRDHVFLIFMSLVPRTWWMCSDALFMELWGIERRHNELNF